MSSDIKINGEQYWPRRSAAIWGTFYTTVVPPISGSRVGLLETTWGSRIAEMSGKVRGISGHGTLGTFGTLTIGFPSGFFSFVPLVSCSIVWNGWLPNAYNAQPNSDTTEPARPYTFPEGYYFWAINVNNQPQYNINQQYYYWPDTPTSQGVQVKNVSNTGFLIVNNPLAYTQDLLGTFETAEYIYINRDMVKTIQWHAFGV